MRRNVVSIVAIMIIASILLCSCGADTNEQASSILKTESAPSVVEEESSVSEGTAIGVSENIETETPTSADGYNILGGTWEVGGIYYRNKIIDINDNDALSGLYRSVFLSFNEDGTYSYLNKVFLHKGTYLKYEKSAEESFLLKTDTVSRLTVENDKLVEVEAEGGDKTTYIITLIDGASSTFVFSEFDSITGNAKATDDPLIFVKSDEDSEYIAENKTDISNNSTGPDTSEKSDANNSNTDKTPITSNATSGERNALKKAMDYLAYSAFSYSGLIEQLEYEGYTNAEATFAADNCGADWEEQALLKAEEYLNYSAFSYNGLIEQLEYEGFSEKEAEHGANNCGADWNDQAVKKAKEYLAYTSFSYDGLVEQLVYEGFSQSQAEYGASKAY